MGNGPVYQPKRFIIGLTRAGWTIRNSYLGFYERYKPASWRKTAFALSDRLYRRFCMKRAVWVLALAISGCATVADIRQTPPTMVVISGKSPQDYARCV